MKAIVISQPGAPDVLRYTDVPDPTPKAGELLVRVRATAVNRADLLQRRGLYPPPPGASDILGLELAGEVVQASGSWRVGERVMAVVTGGSYAEYCTVPAAQALPVPANLTYEQAAAIPEAFETAYLNLFLLGRLERGQTVLIHAGASGVGSAAIQLAHAAGARVLTTAGSPEKLRSCRDFGADVVINYKQVPFAERVLVETDGRGVDLVLDFVGAPYWNANLQALAPRGRLVIIGLLGGSRGELDVGLLLMKSLSVSATTLRRLPPAEKETLARTFGEFALPRFASGELKPVVDSVYPLDQAARAHEVMEANRNTGKLVLVVP